MADKLQGPKLTYKGAGKGDSPRPCNKKRYDANYDRIFGCKKKNTNPKK